MSPCVSDLVSCGARTISNGTNLLWDDMRRTLAFAWELHVFGSASLFALLAGLAFLGMLGATTLVQPLRGSLTLGNSLLLLTGTQRAVLLLLDPYGTREILSRPALAALHNLALHFLLWAQATLALVALRGVMLPRPSVVGALAGSHCALLLAADLLSPVLSRTFPLLLHTLSLCCALSSCIGILGQAVFSLRPAVSDPKPQWARSRQVKNHARRVLLVVCAVLGVLCCCLQVYSLLWLYGVIANWRRFSWSWWLSQFWARVAELAWGFVLLALGSRILWTPQKSPRRRDGWQGRPERSSGFERSFWDGCFIKMGKGPSRHSENNWVDMMPKTWSGCHIHRASLNHNAVLRFDESASTIAPIPMPCPVTSISCDTHAALRWQREGQRDCALSFIEFDMRPPSPIDLVGSIDYALNHGDFSVGNLFESLPPASTDIVNPDVITGQDTVITPDPGHVAFRWTSDTRYPPGSPGHSQSMDRGQSSNVHTDCRLNISPESEETQKKEQHISKHMSGSMHQDWSEEDIKDL